MKIELQQALRKITFDKRHRMVHFNKLSRKEKPYVFMKLSKVVKRSIIEHLRDKQLAVILQSLSPAQATEHMKLILAERRDVIMAMLDENLQTSIELFKEFDPKTAAGLMNTDYIQVDADATIKDVSKQFQIYEKRTGRLPVIIVVDNAKIKGYFPGHMLAIGQATELVGNHVRKLHTIKHHESHEKVLDVFYKHPHSKLGVLGKNGSMVGIIYSDEVLHLIQERESASLYNFAGVHDEETILDPASKKISSRYKWLIINMATAFLASFIVSLFGETIAKHVLLAVYMPIVAGMGGNAGTQTLAVVVRGIALKQIELATARPTIKQEVIAGLGNGIINGVIVAAIVMLFNNDWKIALVLGFAMVFNLLVAAFFGTIVPLIMERLGKDPATSATIFITTATDVLGFLAFLGLASWMLG